MKGLKCLVLAAITFASLAFGEAAFQSPTGHTNNWAVIVSTSKFWFNYRHVANSLSFYRTVKRLGIPDSNIILMLSDDIACNPRNAFQGEVFNNADRQLELYGDTVKVDYRGYEVTVENFIRLLTDRWPEEHPRSKRLLTDENSNIFIYMTGHGGDEFLKFQDAEEISSYDIADAFEQMHEKKRYKEIFFMIDTCQANTMFSKFYSPNILACGSSKIHESSYSHHSDTDIGVAVIDRFTYYNLEFLENVTIDSKLTLQDLFDTYTFENIHSTTGVRTDLFDRDPKDVLITEFFGNVQSTIVDNVEHGLLDSFDVESLNFTHIPQNKVKALNSSSADDSEVNSSFKISLNKTKKRDSLSTYIIISFLILASFGVYKFL